MIWTFNNDWYEPLGVVRSLQREMNRIFNDYDGKGDSFPSVNIWSNQDQVMVTAELPGVNPDDIDISFVQGQLVIKGKRKAELPDGANCHRQERSDGDFARGFRLPFDVDNDKTSAKYKDGILYICLPRAEKTKPKRIAISA